MIISLSLVSHTNVGKTTLARTLLGRDIGEVRDEAHVTLEPERHTMIESTQGDKLELWDTPGFGDSVRLAARMQRAGNPIGWFLTEVWDRFRDRAFWFSQRAVRHVVDSADVVLYLVNAAESPQDVGYLEAELKVLGLIGKPTIVLLNQLGRPKGPDDDAEEVERWREHLRRWLIVQQVLPLDAFARCWVQESILLDSVHDVLPRDHQPAFGRLRDAWRLRQRHIWDESMAVLAGELAGIAVDREETVSTGLTDKLKEVGAALGLRKSEGHPVREAAMSALAARADAYLRAATDRLISLHRLDGQAASAVLQLVAQQFSERVPVDERKAAVLGGLATGALAGLKADIASGGFTLGGGLIAGGVMGAIGAAGVARGVNLVRGVAAPTLAWTEDSLDDFARGALLTYLAVIHHGRGRGAWSDMETVPAWRKAVDETMAKMQESLHALWEQREAAAEVVLSDALSPWMLEAAADLLDRLYPDALGSFMPGVVEG